MQKSEKQSEPSMDEILASIRKIISEEPQSIPSEKAVPVDIPIAAAPPAADLSDLLDEPTKPDPMAMPDAQPPANAWLFAEARADGGSVTALEPAPSGGAATTPNSAVQSPAPSPNLAESLANLANAGFPGAAEPSTGGFTEEPQPASLKEAEPELFASDKSSFVETNSDEETLVSRLKGFEASPSNRFGSLPIEEPLEPATPVFREIEMPEFGAEPSPIEVAKTSQEPATFVAPTAAKLEVAAMEPAAGEFAVESAADFPTLVDDNSLALPAAEGLPAVEEIAPPHRAEIAPATMASGSNTFDALPEPVSFQSPDVAKLPHVLGAEGLAEPISIVDQAASSVPDGIVAEDVAATIRVDVNAEAEQPEAVAEVSVIAEGQIFDGDDREEEAPASPEPAAAVSSASLAAAATPAIESALTELIRPIVVKWLDENAQAHVEAAVEKMLAED